MRHCFLIVPLLVTALACKAGIEENTLIRPVSRDVLTNRPPREVVAEIKHLVINVSDLIDRIEMLEVQSATIDGVWFNTWGDYKSSYTNRLDYATLKQRVSALAEELKAHHRELMVEMSTHISRESPWETNKASEDIGASAPNPQR